RDLPGLAAFLLRRGGKAMAWFHDRSCAHCGGRSPLSAIGLGVAAGVTAAAGLLLGRKVLATARTGKGHPLKHRALDLAAGAMQTKYPLEAMSTYLNGFHMYGDDMGRQVEATHFCIHLRHDLHQCVIFDSNRPDARLIGIEYIISEERFRSLPEEEKRLWHSHHYEVKSGLLVAPGIPELAERAYFKDLVSTYGKTFHNWQYDRDDFPYGIPQLMMGFTGDGQAHPEMVEARDRRLGISTDERRRKREGIPMPEVAEGANSWEGGRTVQTRLEELPMRR
ncbi:OBAP family protein, partial [Roseomonas mucosa]